MSDRKYTKNLGGGYILYTYTPPSCTLVFGLGGGGGGGTLVMVIAQTQPIPKR